VKTHKKQYGKGTPGGFNRESREFGNGPAAVTGDEISIKPLFTLTGWEGGESRVIRESEDLPFRTMTFTIYADKG